MAVYATLFGHVEIPDYEERRPVGRPDGTRTVRRPPVAPGTRRT